MRPGAVFKNVLALALSVAFVLVSSTSGQTASSPPVTVVVDAVSGYAGHAFVFADVKAGSGTVPAPTGSWHQSPYYADWIRVPIGGPSCPWIWAAYVYSRATNQQINPTPPNAPTPNFGTTTLVCASPNRSPVDSTPAPEASARLDLDLNVTVSPLNPFAGSTSTVSATLSSAFSSDLNLYLNMAIRDWSVNRWTVDFGDGQSTTVPGNGSKSLRAPHVYQTAGQFDARVVASISGQAQAAIYDSYGYPQVVDRPFTVEIGNDAQSMTRPASVVRYLAPNVQLLVVPSLGPSPSPLTAGFRRIDALRGALTLIGIRVSIIQEGVMTINGRKAGLGTSTLLAWRLDGMPSDAPAGAGTIPGTIHPSADVMALQWNTPDAVGPGGNQTYQVPVTLYVRTRFPNGHIGNYVIPSTFSVSVNFAADSG